MSTQFPLLFSPIKVGGITLRNRIVNAAHGTGFTKNHRFTDQHLFYYLERARGGAAMIITENASVHPTSNIGTQDTLWGWDPAIVSDYRRLSDQIHASGCHILIQLSHQGRQSGNVEGLPRWAPSPISSKETTYGDNEVPHQMYKGEILEMVEAFATCAALAKQGGMDGIELHAGHGNLIHQFLSPLSNTRQDEYGGDIENRARFALEVIDAVNRKVGNDFVIGIRISADEFLPGGLDLGQMKIISKLLTNGGKIDYLNVSNSTYSDLGSMVNHAPSMYSPPAAFSYLWKSIKESVKVPVLGIGKINTPALAEETLSLGNADLIGMVRELIADPFLPAKAMENRVPEIRPCIACLQSCLGRRIKGNYITCIHNPITGREGQWAKFVPTTRKKKVLVVGGGPGGLEAANTLAKRGHTVTLLEKKGHLGGQVMTAAKAPQRNAFGDIVRFSETQTIKLGVDVRINTEADLHSILNFKADAIVIATGSNAYVPFDPKTSSPRLVTAVEILDGARDVGTRIVVVDTQGLHPGCDVAELLLDQDREVELITTAPYAGSNVHPLVWRLLYQRLLKKGLKVSPFTQVIGLIDGSIKVRHSITGIEASKASVDTIVFADNRRADDRLFRSLKGKAQEVYAIGDCLAPRSAEQAIYEAQKIARSI